MNIRTITLSRILGRQGVLKNPFLSRTKNYMREEGEFTNSCITTNDDRYYNIDERSTLSISNRKRYRGIKF